MRNVLIDANGDPKCWNCGSRAFTNKRTFRAKAIGGAAAVSTFGLAGAVAPLATKKKLLCQACGKYNDVGSAEQEHSVESRLPTNGQSGGGLAAQLASAVADFAGHVVKGHGCSVEVTPDSIAITRAGALASFVRNGKGVTVPLNEIVDFHLRNATSLRNGWLSLGTTTSPNIERETKKAVNDPLTMFFKLADEADFERLADLVVLAIECNKNGIEIGRSISNPIPAEENSPESAGPIGRLEALVEMHRKGLISDEQFAAKQKAILDEM